MSKNIDEILPRPPEGYELIGRQERVEASDLISYFPGRFWTDPVGCVGHTISDFFNECADRGEGVRVCRRRVQTPPVKDSCSSLSAFPVYKSDHRGAAANTTFSPVGGMTKREAFALGALQGMLASAPLCNRATVDKRKWAKLSFEWADAMLIEGVL